MTEEAANSGWERNLEYLKTTGEKGLASWLISSYKDGDFDPLDLSSDLSVGEQLRMLFARLTGREQEKMKRAVARAITEWKLETHPTAMLRRLAYLAADFRASVAVTALRMVIETGQLEYTSESERDETYSTLLAVIGGFSELDEAGEFLERLYVSPTFPAIYRAVIFTALCQRAPAEYPSYIADLIDAIEADNGENFIVELVFQNFVDNVGWSRITRHLEDVREPYRRKLVVNYLRPIFQEMWCQVDSASRKIIMAYVTISDISIIATGHDAAVEGGSGRLFDVRTPGDPLQLHDLSLSVGRATMDVRSQWQFIMSETAA